MAVEEQIMPIRLLCTLIALNLCAYASAREAQPGLRFDSPGELDLAERPVSIGKPVPFAALDAAAASAILAAPVAAEESLKFSEDDYGCKAPACVKEREAQRIAGANGAVKRMKKRLTIAADSGPPAAFVDWKSPPTKTADGDEETHWYLGRLPGSGYHRVEVQFGHDAPGSFLVNPKNGKTAFVHNTSDVVVLSPDGLHVVTFNAEFPPFVLRVAALDATGPRVELICTAPVDERMQPQFKGWRGADTFDLVIRSSNPDTAMRFSRVGAGWNVAVAGSATDVACSTESLGRL